MIAGGGSYFISPRGERQEHADAAPGLPHILVSIYTDRGLGSRGGLVFLEMAEKLKQRNSAKRSQAWAYSSPCSIFSWQLMQ